MSYNRLGREGGDDGWYSPVQRSQYANRSPFPSPSPPLQIQDGYQLEDDPRQQHQQQHQQHQHQNMPPPPHLRMPEAAGDRVSMQQAYDNDYAVDPEQHQGAYYNEAYQPNPQGDYAVDQYGQQGGGYRDDNDQRPILAANNPYGPNPDLEPDYQDDPPVEHDDLPAGPGIQRWKSQKLTMELFNGNLVLDCPIPPMLLHQVPHAEPPERDEFTHMRYSAATCDPADFFQERFTLRQKLFAIPRHTELFIVVTMYNEDDFLFARTMCGVFKNIEYMCSRTSSKTWGKQAWKKIVVCVVSDGRAKINPRTRAVLAGLGVYQDGIAKQQVNGKDVTAHIYEYTTQVGMEMKGKQVVLKPRSGVPVQMLFCLKEKNQKKINSHRWFFQAFGRVLDPNVCVLLDAGTKPGKKSIYQLWKAFDLEPMCGGACGEIKVMLNHGAKLINPLVATQNFEYKMSNILDKPLESAFGFISVLPGAFSAYRYVALQNDKNGDGPLEKYFAGEKMHGANAGIFTSNMYLAEDRILCFELVTKRNCRWILQYVKSANGETDVPDRMAEFILQRRRWLNGSFFAAVYAITHFYQLWRSDHGAIRKLMLLIEFFYQAVNLLFAWFAIGNFFLVFRILITSLGDEELLGDVGRILGVVFEWAYLLTLLTCFILSLGNRPQGSGRYYMTMVIFWCLLMVYLAFAAVFVTVRSIQSEVAEEGFSFSSIFQNMQFFSIIVSLLATYVLWIVASLLFLDPWHMITCFLQYIVLTPTYINVLNIYAFCNTHDITWGTKGDDKAEKLPSATVKADGKVDVLIPQDDGDLNALYEAELQRFAAKPPKEVKTVSESEKQEDYYKGIRSSVVLFWIFCNFALASVVLGAAGINRIVVEEDEEAQEETENRNTTIYMAVVLWSVAVLSLFRFIGAIWFLVVRLFRGV